MSDPFVMRVFTVVHFLMLEKVRHLKNHTVNDYRKIIGQSSENPM